MREGDFRQKWHETVNRFHDDKHGEHRRWMYEAMDMMQEVSRLTRILGMERRGELTKKHKQCSLSPTEPVADNHLTCCLGVECRKCPELLALDSAELPPEKIDEAKAWTCVSHIASQGGDPAKEGYLLTVDDRMFWDRVYENLSTPSGHPDDEENPDA